MAARDLLKRDISQDIDRLVAVTAVAVPIAKRIAKDERVRAATQDAFVRGRRVYEDVSGSNIQDVVARMAREEDFQRHVAAAVRSATQVVDSAVAASQRRRRRVTLWLAIAGALLSAVAAWRVRGSRRPSEQTAEPAPNSGTPAESTTPTYG
jgi:hypothetical protein